MATFTLNSPQKALGPAVSLALAQEVDPTNLVIGDLAIRNGQLFFWDKNASRAQKVRTILQFIQGEWFLDPTQGLPYFGGDMISSRRRVIPALIRQALVTGLPDLKQVVNITLDVDSKRVGTVNFELLFDDGFVLKSADFGPVKVGA